MHKIKAGVIGTGFGEVHLELLSQIDGVDIQWLGFQSNRKKAEQLASRYHIPNITSDYKEITRSSVDFIVVVTPVYTHLDMIQEAMVTGKHVITDKPLALNLRQCEELVRLEKQYPIKSMIFFQWRFNNLLRTLRTMLDEKAIGNIYFFDTAFYTEFMADENIPYLWRHNEDLGGSGVLSDMGVHLIDLLYWLTNGETVIEHSVLKTVYPIRKIETGKVRATTEDFAKVQFSLQMPDQKDTAVGAMTVCRTSHGVNMITFMILGTKGSIHLTLNPITGDGDLLLNNKKIASKYQLDENPYHYWIRYMQGEQVELPLFEDGLKSQKVINEIKEK